jgi:hypothetical protein
MKWSSACDIGILADFPQAERLGSRQVTTTRPIDSGKHAQFTLRTEPSVHNPAKRLFDQPTFAQL